MTACGMRFTALQSHTQLNQSVHILLHEAWQIKCTAVELCRQRAARRNSTQATLALQVSSWHIERAL